MKISFLLFLIFIVSSCSHMSRFPAKDKSLSQTVCLAESKQSVDVDLYWKLGGDEEVSGAVEDICQVSVGALRPTQFSVGMIEVQRKVEELFSMSESKLHKYLKKNPEPVVIGPKGEFYIIDHHHLGRALFEIGVEHTYAIILESWYGQDEEKFWAYMVEKNWTYLSENGVKKTYKNLAKVQSVKDLKDDPFRTLAGQTRCKKEAKCVEGQWLKKPIPFIEFLWADYFRKVPAIVEALKNYGKLDFRKVTMAATEEVKRVGGVLPSTSP